MAAWFSLYNEYGFDFGVISKIPLIELSAKMVFYAAQQGNFKRGKSFDHTFAEFTYQIANMRNADGEKLKGVFMESARVVGDNMKAIGESQSKKK